MLVLTVVPDEVVVLKSPACVIRIYAGKDKHGRWKTKARIAIDAPREVVITRQKINTVAGAKKGG